ncbi:MAG: hypothetical protein AAB911_01740 [Patescibacteria group bacterium]
MTRGFYFRLSANKKKIILLLASGVALSLAGSPKSYFKVLNSAAEEWRRINRNTLKRAIKSLYRSKLVEELDKSNGSTTMILSERGKEQAISFNIETMQIKKPKHWDGKWRVALFDIPEKRKPAREALRATLKKLGFYEFQKSVFIYPYPCANELDYVIEFFRIRPYVRTMLVTSMDNELHLKQIFGV